MFEFERIVEQRILDAIARGELQGLPGEGRPLDLDDDRLVPAEMRLAYRILKNAGYIPEEVTLRRQIFELEQLLDAALEDAERLKAVRRLDLLRARLSARRRRESLGNVEGAYRQRLVNRFKHACPPSTGDGRNG